MSDKRKPKFRVGQVVRLPHAKEPLLDEFVKIRRAYLIDGRWRYGATNYMLGRLSEALLRPLTAREKGKP